MARDSGSAQERVQVCVVVLTRASGATEPDVSVSSGTRVTVPASLSAGATPCTGTETVQVSPGSNGGESWICPAWTRRRPNGPDTDTVCRAARMALPVLWIVYVTVASPFPKGLGVPV